MITLQTYEKVCKAKKTETTRNNVVANTRESGAVGPATDVFWYV